MAGQLTIFTPMVEALTKEIATLVEYKKKMEAQNKSYEAEIASNRACLDGAEWYDRKEMENDILNAEREIRSNKEIIAKLEKDIEAKQKQRADYISAMESMNGKRR